MSWGVMPPHGTTHYMTISRHNEVGGKLRQNFLKSRLGGQKDGKGWSNGEEETGSWEQECISMVLTLFPLHCISSGLQQQFPSRGRSCYSCHTNSSLFLRGTVKGTGQWTCFSHTMPSVWRSPHHQGSLPPLRLSYSCLWRTGDVSEWRGLKIEPV